MTKRIMLLSGLAILAVVLNHASGWGYTAMVYWTDQYRPVIAPNYDQVGGLSYYGLVIIDELTEFSVPAFLFVAGFFIAYASRADSRGLGWKPVRARIVKLLIPYILWSIFVFVENALQGKVLSVRDYIYQLLTGGATGAYWFVPMLCEFYLLSFLFVRLAKRHPRALLITTSLITFLTSGIFYLKIFGVYLPDGLYATSRTFLWYAFYFSLGIVVGLNLKSFQITIPRFGPTLIILTMVFGAMSVIEAVLLHKVTGDMALAIAPFKFSMVLYAIVFILAFLSIDATRWRISEGLSWAGARSYGIYLITPILLEFIARLTRRIAPGLLAFQLIFTMVLAITSIAFMWLIIEGVSRSRMSAAYHYLFG
jgi:probable poly-beta-1,6-N-acetyl-D-glucosamine export protein